jgi:hypothetical protein
MDLQVAQATVDHQAMAGQATDHQANGKVTIFHLKATKNPKIL